MKKNILIINQYGANKGDRAVLFALIKELLKANVCITVSTHKPSLWSEYEFYTEAGVKFVPWGWDFENEASGIYWKFLNRIKKYIYSINREIFLLAYKLPFFINRFFVNPLYYESVNAADIIISTGGHHITTLLSRDAISSQIFDLSVAIRSGKKSVIWSQSIGPLDFFNKRNENFVKKVLNTVDFIYLRDDKSTAYFDDNDARIKITYESVFLLNNIFQQYTPQASRDNIFGVSIYSTKNRNFQEREEYIKTMAEVADFVISTGMSVRFFPMELKHSEPDDRQMISEIISCTRTPSKCYLVDEDLNTDIHLHHISKCRIFLGHKTHSIIFALTTGTPLVALAYHPKSNEFMKQFSLERYAVKDEDFSAIRVNGLIRELIINADEIGERCFMRSRELSQIISDDLEKLLN